MKLTFRVSVLAALVLVCVCNNPSGKIPTVYDVLQLVYQVCSTQEVQRMDRLECVSSHMGKEVMSVLEMCIGPGSDSLQSFCEHLTHVPEWAAKHNEPPRHLTRIMGLAALGRMACVLGDVQRPLPMWQAAFSKCFPEFQSASSLRKDSSLKNKNANTIN